MTTRKNIVPKFKREDDGSWDRYAHRSMGMSISVYPCSQAVGDGFFVATKGALAYACDMTAEEISSSGYLHAYARSPNIAVGLLLEKISRALLVRDET